MPAYAYISQRDGSYGVCESWDEVLALRNGQRGIFVSRRFETPEEAHRKIEHATRPYDGGPVAFVDGAGSDNLFHAGAGMLLLMDGIGTKPTCEIAMPVTNMLPEGQIPGELIAAMLAVSKAEQLGARSLLIAYDYMGIMAVAEGLYAPKSGIAGIWHDTAQSARDRGLDIRFRHVYSHEGVSDDWQRGNAYVDMLAKTGTRCLYGSLSEFGDDFRNLDAIKRIDGWLPRRL